MGHSATFHTSRQGLPAWSESRKMRALHLHKINMRVVKCVQCTLIFHYTLKLRKTNDSSTSEHKNRKGWNESNRKTRVEREEERGQAERTNNFLEVSEQSPFSHFPVACSCSFCCGVKLILWLNFLKVVIISVISVELVI